MCSGEGLVDEALNLFFLVSLSLSLSLQSSLLLSSLLTLIFHIFTTHFEIRASFQILTQSLECVKTIWRLSSSDRGVVLHLYNDICTDLKIAESPNSGDHVI